MGNYKLIELGERKHAEDVLRENVGKRIFINTGGCIQDIFTEGILNSFDDHNYYLNSDDKITSYYIAGLRKILIPE